MATYNSAAVTNSVIAYQKPITLQQGRALRDNPLSIAEADGTVPLSLLPSVRLGTLTTTSGTTQTLSGLDLTPYKFLICTINGVSTAASGADLQFGGANVAEGIATSADQWYGSVLLDLSNGVATAIVSSGILPPVGGGLTGYSTASTSISFSLFTSAFDAGSIRIWGAK